MDPKQINALLSRILANLRQETTGADSSPVEEGALFCVEESSPGRFAVIQEGTQGAAPFGVFDDRKTACVVAAALIALGTPLPETVQADEIREPTAFSTDTSLEVRLITGLLRNPAATELLLEAADLEVLRKALSIVALGQTPDDTIN